MCRCWTSAGSVRRGRVESERTALFGQPLRKPGPGHSVCDFARYLQYRRIWPHSTPWRVRRACVAMAAIATAMALLASGHVDLVVEAGLQPYDYMALIPVIEGAGGVITDWAGQPPGLDSDGRVIAAATPPSISRPCARWRTLAETNQERQRFERRGLALNASNRFTSCIEVYEQSVGYFASKDLHMKIHELKLAYSYVKAHKFGGASIVRR